MKKENNYNGYKDYLSALDYLKERDIKTIDLTIDQIILMALEISVSELIEIRTKD